MLEALQDADDVGYLQVCEALESRLGPAGAEAGDPGLASLRDRGYLDDMRRSVAYVESILPSLQSELVPTADRPEGPI